jgi:hypothetical protein
MFFSQHQSSLDPPSSFLPGINLRHFVNLDKIRADWIKNERLVVIEDFFDKQTFAKIRDEVARLWKSDEVETNCNLDGRDRLGGYVRKIYSSAL